MTDASESESYFYTVTIQRERVIIEQRTALIVAKNHHDAQRQGGELAQLDARNPDAARWKVRERMEPSAPVVVGVARD